MPGLDAGRLDDRPPLLDFRLLEALLDRGDRLQRHASAPEVGDAPSAVTVGELAESRRTGSTSAVGLVTWSSKAKRVRVANPAVGKDLTDWVSHGATEVDIQSSAVDAFEVVQATSEAMPASPAGSLDEPALERHVGRCTTSVED